MKKNLIAKAPWLVGIGLLGLSQAATASVAIDDFGGAGQNLFLVSGVSDPAVWSSLPTPNAIGGERDLILSTQTPGGYFAQFAANGSGLGLLTATSNFGTQRYEVQWDGVDDSAALDPTGLGGVDLLTPFGGRADDAHFIADFLPTTNIIDLTVSVYTDAANWSFLTMPTPQVVPGGVSPVAERWQFASFVAGGGSGANFANVGAITMSWLMNSTSGENSMRMDFMSAVPEPGTTLLLLCGIIALPGAMRRRIG